MISKIRDFTPMHHSDEIFLRTFIAKGLRKFTKIFFTTFRSPKAPKQHRGTLMFDQVRHRSSRTKLRVSFLDDKKSQLYEDLKIINCAETFTKRLTRRSLLPHHTKSSLFFFLIGPNVANEWFPPQQVVNS